MRRLRTGCERQATTNVYDQQQAASTYCHVIGYIDFDDALGVV